VSGSIDTSREADERQMNAFRAMSPGARLRLAESMSAEITMLTRSGIQARHPEYTPADVDEALAQILLGGVRPVSEPRSRRLVRPR
jgi:hypothetical protein